MLIPKKYGYHQKSNHQHGSIDILH